MHDIKKITQKIVIIPLAIFSIFVVTSIAIFAFIQNKKMHELISFKLQQTTSVLSYVYSNYVNSIQQSIIKISENQNIIRAWTQKDRASLNALSKDILRDLQSNFGVTKLFFIENNKKIFLRTHSPQEFGDFINHQVVMQIDQTQTFQAGFEIGFNNTLDLKGSAPIYHNAKLIGYIEVAINPNHILEQVFKMNGGEIFFLLKKNLQKTDRTKLVDDFYISNTSNITPSSHILSFFKENQISALKFNQIYNLNKDSYFRLKELKDAAAKNIGIILVKQNIKHEYDAIISSMIIFIVSILFLGILCIWLLYKQISKIIFRLQLLYNELTYEISKRKEAEEKNKELQTSIINTGKMAALSDMGSGIAHELNNPLTIIQGYSEKITREIDNNTITPATIKTATNKILEQSKRMIKIIQHIKDFSGSSIIECKEFIQMETLIENSLLLFNRQLLNNNIEVSIDIHDELPKLFITPTKMESAIHSIIVNAMQELKAIDDGRRKFISIKCYKSSADSLAIAIADSGRGIPENIIEKIFDPFFTTKSPGNGTGLGLAIAYGIIKENDGTISAKNLQNLGTLFTITLPIKDPDHLESLS